MRLLFCLFLITSFLSCSSSIENNEDNTSSLRALTADEQVIVNANHDFSFEVFQHVNENDRPNNIFISPLSVSMALGMTLNGAAGNTFDDMRSALGVPDLDNSAINKAYQSLLELLSTADQKVLFEIANAIWYEKTFSVEKSFLKTNQTYFDAEIAGLDFSDPASVDVINDWVSEKTHEKIKKLIGELSPETVMALVNAIYFKASWKYEFDVEETIDDIFINADGQPVECRMMQISENFLYYKDDDVQIIDLPYGNSNFSMTLLQPAVGMDINDFILNLSNETWHHYLTSLSSDSGDLQMPKFKMSYKSKTEAVLLNGMLEEMGMGNAFIPGVANFSRINPSTALFISKVLHKTFIQVDEEGTEAAAATIVLIDRTSVEPDGAFFMRLDRPFVFVIHEHNTGAILFIGKMMQPEWHE